MAGFIECDSLTFTDGSVVTPGGEHLGHPLTRDALGSLKHMVSITGELNRRPDAAAFRPEQTQESMKESSHACPRIDQTVWCRSKCHRRNIIRSFTVMEITRLTVRFIYSGDGRRFATILTPSLYETANGSEDVIQKKLFFCVFSNERKMFRWALIVIVINWRKWQHWVFTQFVSCS